jgi:organic hydroperoxide reductase OsmC/OhrA
MTSHNYTTTIKWTGNNGEGTKDYKAYERSHILSVAGKPDILCSSDTPFRGEASKHNPEDMLLASLSSCHMLWYLHLCADAGIIVTDYEDTATGTLVLPPGGSGHFSEVVLHPVVTITDESRKEEANALHDKAHKSCFIANSVNFPVKHEPACRVAETV